MRRYAIALVLLIAPCVALGLWSWQRYAHARTEEAAALAASWQALARARALAVLRDGSCAGPAPPTPEAALTNWGTWLRRCGDAPASPVLIVDAQGLRRMLPLVLPALPSIPPAPPDPELAQARRLEFATENASGALVLYRHLHDRSGLGPALRAEASAGIIACLHHLGREQEAVAVLATSVRHAELRPGQAGALALELLEHADGAAAELALHAWMAVAGAGTEPIMASHLAQQVRAHRGALGPEREAADVLLAFEAADVQHQAWWETLNDDERIDLRAVGPHLVALHDGRLAVTRGIPSGWTLVAVRSPAALARQLSESIARDPQLLLLAHSYARQFQGAISDGRPLSIDLPDGSSLSIRVSPPSIPPASWLERHLPAVGIAASIALVLAAGMILMMRTAARDSRLARLRAEFVSTVSHELKTPLSLIRLYAEMLELGYASSAAETQRARAVILDETQRLQGLVEHVLAADTIDRGSLTLRLQPCDLGALVRTTLDSYRPRLDRDGFEVEAACAAGGPYVQADRDALTRILINLISNAVTYSTDRRFLRVGAHASGGSAVIEVADRGIGIPREQQERIFDRFYRIDGSLAREHRGLGLGLSVVRSLARAHGGEVSVASTPGEGSTFTVRLPLGPPLQGMP